MRQPKNSHSYTPVDYVLPAGTYTGGLRRATPPEPHDCPGCGSLADDPNPAHLVDGSYLDCPRCSTRPVYDTDERTPDQQLSADVRDILAEEASRGSGRPSSSGGGRKKRNGNHGRMAVRFEQEVAAFLNGHSGDSVTIKRFETASERFELQLTLDCRERLREVAHDRRNEYGDPYPQVQLIRDAMQAEMLRLTSPREIERGTPRAQMQLRLYPSELILIDSAAAYWEMSRHQILEACLWEFLGE